MSMPERRYVPEVRRPRGPAWRTLQTDGLLWECQVFLVGADVDLAALLIITRNRFALARGGNVVLETDREWLRPAPRLLPDGTVLINVAPPATAEGQPESHSLLLRMREGWRDASHLESLLAGGRGRSALGRRAPATPPPFAEAEADPAAGSPSPGGRPDGYRWHDAAFPPAGSPGSGRTPATEPDLPWARPRPGQLAGAASPADPGQRDDRADRGERGESRPRPDSRPTSGAPTRPGSGPASGAPTGPVAGTAPDGMTRERADPRPTSGPRPDRRDAAAASTASMVSPPAHRPDRPGAVSRSREADQPTGRAGPDAAARSGTGTAARLSSDPVSGRAEHDSLAGAASSRRRSRPEPWSADPGQAPIEASVRSDRSDRSPRSEGTYVVPAPAGPPPSGRYFDWNAPDAEVVTSRESRRKRGWWGRLTGILLLLLTVTAAGVMFSDRDDDGRSPARTEVAAVGDSPITGNGTEPIAGTTGDGDTMTPAPAAGETETRPANPETAVAIGVGGEGSLTPAVSTGQAVPAAPATTLPMGAARDSDPPAGTTASAGDPSGGAISPAAAGMTPAADDPTDDPPAAPTRTVAPARPATGPAGDPTRTPASERSADRTGDGTSDAGDEVTGAGAAGEETATATSDVAGVATTAITRDPATEPTDPATEPATEPAPEAPATAEPAPEAPATPTRAPRPAATETAPAPTVTETGPTPTETEAAPAPTETEAPPTVTPEPTVTPVPPTETPVPPTETPVPPTEEPDPVFPEQAATVDEDTYTAPVMGAGAFRVTVESTMRGSSLPTLGLPFNPYGDWLVAIVLMENWSDAPANLIMADFGLITANPFVGFQPLDSGTAIVGSTLGFSTVLGSSDVAVIISGEARRVALLFTADPAGIGLSLRYGASVMGLQSSLEISPNATDLGAPARTPVLLAATVTAIIDGATIEVEADGAVARVRYAALSAPGEDACYGPEATEANAALVDVGETVYLERQATDADEDGTLVRDVWLDRDGGLTLAGQTLAAEGALDVSADGQDVRYLSWLQLTVSDASFAGLGRWGACGTASAGLAGLGAPDGAASLAAAAPGFVATLPRPPQTPATG